MTDRAVMADLVNALEQAAAMITEMDCTCANDRHEINREHRRGLKSTCRGVVEATRLRAVAYMGHRRLAGRLAEER